MVTAVVGCILLTLAVIHAFIPHASATFFLVLYAAGAICAFSAIYSSMNLWLARILAVATTGMMFFYFATFFKMAPHFQEEWYRSGLALEGIGMLLSAFALIPVLSCYSCMLKADCREQLQDEKKRPAFFAVPDGIPDNR